MHLAAHAGSLEILKLLIQKGGDVNLVDTLMGTPLQAAINPFGEIRDDVVQYLIKEAGADVNVHGGWFGSTLNAACLKSSLEQVKQIIDKGADVNWADDFGRRPIHYASLKTLEHLKLLLDAGADITAKTKTGQSLLHIATVTGNVELVESILSKTNDLINDPDDDGWTYVCFQYLLVISWPTLLLKNNRVVEVLQGSRILEIGSSNYRSRLIMKILFDCQNLCFFKNFLAYESLVWLSVFQLLSTTYSSR